MSSIKIITSPSVFLVGSQVVNEYALRAFLESEGVGQWKSDSTAPGQVLCEVAGRLCYMSYSSPRPGGNAAYLKHILEVGHGSVLESAVYTLIITGISRSCSHELVRHRVGLSPSQLSQRYVDESDVAFVLPPAIPNDPNSLVSRIWYYGCVAAAGYYRALADELEKSPEIAALPPTERRKAAREAARSVLPNAAETKIQLTGNARAWRSLLELRGSRHADAEIRRLAFAILAALLPAAPDLFGDYRIVDGEGGVQEIVTDYPRV